MPGVPRARWPGGALARCRSDRCGYGSRAASREEDARRRLFRTSVVAMVLGLIELALVLLVVGLLGLGAWAYWRAWVGPRPGRPALGTSQVLPPGARAELA